MIWADLAVFRLLNVSALCPLQLPSYGALRFRPDWLAVPQDRAPRAGSSCAHRPRGPVRAVGYPDEPARSDRSGSSATLPDEPLAGAARRGREMPNVPAR